MNAPYGPPPAPSPYAQSPHAQDPYAQNPYVQNPYAAPAPVPGVPHVDGVLPRASRLDSALYNANSVVLATFLGTPFGGSVLLALNEHRVGRSAAALKTLLLGFVATGALFALAMMLPQSIPRFPVSIGPLIAMGAIARARQEAFVRQHLAVGGKKGSAWAAAGLGLLSTVVVLLPFMVVLVIIEMASQPG